CADAGWIYCPTEVFVATRRSRLATTAHCLSWFEPELPWYSNPETRSTRRRLRMAWGPVFRNSDLILTVSEFSRHRIAALMGVEEQRIVVVGNGVEDDYFDAGRSPPNQPVRPRPYVAVVGGLSEAKGGHTVLAVARELLARRSETEIVVAGHTEPPFLRGAAELPNLVHLGYVSTASGLPRLLSGAVALLFLSRYETFGIPAAEAMAAGTPAIVSRFAALPEIVGDAGVVLESDDLSEIVDRIVELERNDPLRRDLIARGLKRAARFRWSACAAEAVRAMRERS
ncbi:MAG TPA: glycosyltransferase family 1 protein, partial [Gemmatimonadaceae bacterium]|nr:glycosyltransferase family 1 protein [Gemmatimonadaceae bacterium]